MQEMEKFVKKYDKLSSAFDRVCAELSLGSQYYQNTNKDAIKEHFLNE